MLFVFHIFDTSFKSNTIPDQWRSAIVVPVHKIGITSDPNNYRPISLTSTSYRGPVTETALERALPVKVHGNVSSISRYYIGLYVMITVCISQTFQK